MLKRLVRPSLWLSCSEDEVNGLDKSSVYDIQTTLGVLSRSSHDIRQPAVATVLIDHPKNSTYRIRSSKLYKLPSDGGRFSKSRYISVLCKTGVADLLGVSPHASPLRDVPNGQPPQPDAGR